ncbi:QRFP-like peptide receptor [Oculina patagonica]
MNNSSVDNFENQSTCSHIVSTTLVAVIAFVSISAFVGNFLVTVIFLKNASLRTSTNYFIVNMAVSDLLSAVTNWPLFASEGMLSRKRIIEDSMATFVCKLGIYSRSISQAVSVLSLVLIVVDRYIAIVRPFQATRITKRFRAVLLFFTWIFSLSFGFPYVWFSKIVQEGHQTFCRFSYSWSKMGLAVFYTMGFLTFYCIPLILITMLYCKIMKCLTRTRPVDETRRHSIRTRNRQQNKIVMKVFISIVTAFFLCWTPLCAYILLKMVFPSLFAKDKCMLFLGLSYYVFPSLSTAINPVILFVSSSRFSNSLKEMFGCLICKLSCRSNSVSPQREIVELQVAQ